MPLYECLKPLAALSCCQQNVSEALTKSEKLPYHEIMPAHTLLFPHNPALALAYWSASGFGVS